MCILQATGLTWPHTFKRFAMERLCPRLWTLRARLRECLTIRAGIECLKGIFAIEPRGKLRQHFSAPLCAKGIKSTRTCSSRTSSNRVAAVISVCRVP